MLENQEFWFKDFGLLTLFKDIKVRCSQVILPALGFDTEVTQVRVSKNLYRNNLGCHQFYCRFFLNFKFIYFNWRLVTLQYCTCSATYQHESATGSCCSPS